MVINLSKLFYISWPCISSNADFAFTRQGVNLILLAVNYDSSDDDDVSDPCLEFPCCNFI